MGWTEPCGEAGRESALSEKITEGSRALSARLPGRHGFDPNSLWMVITWEKVPIISLKLSEVQCPCRSPSLGLDTDTQVLTGTETPTGATVRWKYRGESRPRQSGALQHYKSQCQYKYQGGRKTAASLNQSGKVGKIFTDLNISDL